MATLNLSQTDIVNLVIDALNVRLNDYLKDNQTDDAKAGLIRPGKLQDDPTKYKISILIHPGGEEYPDGMNVHNSPSYGKFIDNVYTIGGGGSKFYLRYVKLEFQMFFTNSPNRDDQRKKAQLVMDRAAHHIDVWDVGREVPKDDLGEHAYDLQVVKQWLFEGGGDGDFNWRGWLVVEFLTEKELT